MRLRARRCDLVALVDGLVHFHYAFAERTTVRDDIDVTGANVSSSVIVQSYRATLSLANGWEPFIGSCSRN